MSALAAAAALALAGQAGASTGGAGTTGSAAAHGPANVALLSLRPMPTGTAAFGRGRHGQLTVHADMFGLTPGSSHAVILVIPGSFRVVRFSNEILHNGQPTIFFRPLICANIRPGAI